MPALGRYELMGRLGSGSFATVYRARDPMLGRDVALKALFPNLAEQDEDHRRFLAEARALAQLHHPNIVTVYDVGEDGGRPYFAMELLEGKTLAELLARQPQQDLPRTAAVVTALATALTYLHGLGLVHRDVKPENVMLCRDGRVMLMDFGIALSPGGARLTKAGYGLGTPESVAPEQIRGVAVTAAADVYALGALAYRMLGGKAPFSGDVAQLLYAHAHQLPPLLITLRRGLPTQLYGAIDAALAKDPAARPSAAAFAQAFAATPHGERPAPPTVPASPARATKPPILYKLSGTDNAVHSGLYFAAAITLFTCTCVAGPPRSFRVRLLNRQGVELRTLVSALGAYSGTTAYAVPGADAYTLVIGAAAKWSVEIEQPAITALVPERTPAGQGDAVCPIWLEAGIHRLRIRHQTRLVSPFHVTLLDPQENRADRLASAAGTFSGDAIRKIAEDGVYLLAVEASGNWRVELR